MSLLNKKTKLVRKNGKLVKIGSTNQQPQGKVPGLYDENDNLIKTWDELVSEGLVTVE